MGRQLATIQTISDVQPIENADAIVKVRVGGWWCVARVGEFMPGDQCVFFEIDSLLPNEHPAFSFLEKSSRVVTILKEDGGTASGYRLKTVRLRGQISQGLALPLVTFGLGGLEPGTDVSEQLGILKWEPPISKQMAAIARGPFPSFIPKTDEERVQNLGETIARHAGEPFYVTEKLDGSSITVYATEERFGVCSRNLDLLEGNMYWNAVNALGIADKLPIGFAIQGELIGEGIQGNPLKRKGHELYVFNVYNIADGRYLDFDGFITFCEDWGFTPVPVIGYHWPLPASVETLINMADGESMLTPGASREGLVFRPMKEQREEIRGSQQRLSFKAISNKYLLRGDR